MAFSYGFIGIYMVVVGIIHNAIIVGIQRESTLRWKHVARKWPKTDGL